MKLDFFEYFKLSLENDDYSHSYLVETNQLNIFLDEYLSFLYNNKYLKNKVYDNNINLKIITPNDRDVITIDMIDDLVNGYKYIGSSNISFYIIHESDKMNSSAMNKLLKFLEEPNPNIIGLFITSDSNGMLETILSRTQRFSINYKSEKELSEDVTNFIDLIHDLNYEKELLFRDKYKSDRPNLNQLLNSVLDLNKVTDYSIINIIDHVLLLVSSNVNILLALDYLFIELRKYNKKEK